jgi:hypothetical protein
MNRALVHDNPRQDSSETEGRSQFIALRSLFSNPFAILKFAR